MLSTELHTVKLQSIDQSTIQFWILYSKGHSTSNFSFIYSLKIIGRATNRDMLLYISKKLHNWSHLSNMQSEVISHRYLQKCESQHFRELVASRTKSLHICRRCPENKKNELNILIGIVQKVCLIELSFCQNDPPMHISILDSLLLRGVS